MTRRVAVVAALTLVLATLLQVGGIAGTLTSPPETPPPESPLLFPNVYIPWVIVPVETPQATGPGVSLGQ